MTERWFDRDAAIDWKEKTKINIFNRCSRNLGVSWTTEKFISTPTKRQGWNLADTILSILVIGNAKVFIARFIYRDCTAE